MKTSITVVDKISAEAPASATILDRTRLEEIPGVNADDVLRFVPGFTLFRRSSGITSHPTTQGVSLRGIGSSGASRTLVLWDGVPINDPFGGWVYWTRIPMDQVERIEVSRGASTSVFGDRAMAGSIGFFTSEPERWRMFGSYQGGSRDTHEASVGASTLGSQWAASAFVRAFTTDGYWVVRQRDRGAVDRPASVDFVAGATRLDWFHGRDRLFLKLDILAEQRANGTVLQNNSTSLGTLAGNYYHEQGPHGVSVLGWHTREEFRSSFSAIAADRNTERLTYNQTVPATQIGGAAFYRYTRSSGEILAGADVSRVEGFSNDALVPTGLRIGGGRQLQHGTFAQANLPLGLVRFFGGVRYQFTGNDQTFFSPSAGLTVGRGRIRARGSVYRAYRAPTLNELFREFRAGNAVTQANASLLPEKLFGAEAGLDFAGESTHASLTFYRNSLTDLITNVTLLSTPVQIVRQRRNTGSALARGMEAEVLRHWGDWEGMASYLFSDARVATKERIAQSPRHTGSAQLSWHHAGTLASAGVRSTAAQFEDDRNQFLLPGFATLQLVMRQNLARGFAATLEFENLLDREYLTGFSPTPTIGPPRLWRVGIRWEARLH